MKSTTKPIIQNERINSMNVFCLSTYDSIKNAKKPTMANESLISPSVYRFDICIILYYILSSK